MTEEELRKEIRKEYEKAGSYKAFADQIGISPSHVGDLVHGRRRAGKKVLKAMGLKRLTTVHTKIVAEK